jgi:hypothetical protein
MHVIIGLVGTEELGLVGTEELGSIVGVAWKMNRHYCSALIL